MTVMDKIFKAYVYKNLIWDVQRFLKKNLKNVRDVDFDKAALLHRVGLAEYSPGKATVTGISLVLLGGLAGAVIALALAPKSGVELRSELKSKMNRGFERAQGVGLETPARA